MENLSTVSQQQRKVFWCACYLSCAIIMHDSSLLPPCLFAIHLLRMDYNVHMQKLRANNFGIKLRLITVNEHNAYYV